MHRLILKHPCGRVLVVHTVSMSWYCCLLFEAEKRGGGENPDAIFFLRVLGLGS